ncbi:MAG: hypothetical protein AB7V61_13010 [Methylocystis sp.]
MGTPGRLWTPTDSILSNVTRRMMLAHGTINGFDTKALWKRAPLIFGAVPHVTGAQAEVALTLVAIFHFNGLLSRFAAPKVIAALHFSRDQGMPRRPVVRRATAPRTTFFRVSQ